jgi:hypothetical protein
MEWIFVPKIGGMHRVGNVLTGMLKIVDGIVMVVTVGFVSSQLTLNFTILRKRYNILIDNRK